MITYAGNSAIGNALAQALGATMAFGIGSSVPQLTDTQLDFEVFRTPVRISSYDATTGRLTLSASLPESLDITMSEIGLYNSSSDSGGLLTTFDPISEEWSGGTWSVENARLGEEALTVALGTASMSAGSRVSLSNVKLSDVLQVAYFGAGGTVEVRMKNTDADYYSYSFTPSAGYNVSSAPVSSLVKTGMPDFSSVESIDVIHSGTGSVTMDAIRIHSTDEDDSLVMRQVLTGAVRKVGGMPMDIEIPLEINL